MRFMMIMIPNVSEENWAAERRGDRHDVQVQRRADQGRRPARPRRPAAAPAKGARVSFAGGKPSVTDGPFTEAKELIGGYWLIQARSKEEAVEWATRCPADDGDIIEVRQVYEMSDFDEAA